jgi:hypothetical protein
LPFVASDGAIHQMLAEHTVQEAIRLQVALGKLRRASDDFQGKVLAIDPHRVRSYSQRHMRKHAKKASERPIKMAANNSRRFPPSTSHDGGPGLPPSSRVTP